MKKIVLLWLAGLLLTGASAHAEVTSAQDLCGAYTVTSFKGWENGTYTSDGWQEFAYENYTILIENAINWGYKNGIILRGVVFGADELGRTDLGRDYFWGSIDFENKTIDFHSDWGWDWYRVTGYRYDPETGLQDTGNGVHGTFDDDGNITIRGLGSYYNGTLASCSVDMEPSDAKLFHWNKFKDGGYYNQTLEDGTVLNFRKYNSDDLRLVEIATESEDVTIPAYLTITEDGAEVDYPLVRFGHDGDREYMFAQAPSLKKLTLPETINSIQFNLNAREYDVVCNLDELHMTGPRPYLDYSITACPVYIDNRDYYLDYLNNWTVETILRGFEKTSGRIDVDRPGAFTYLYKVATDADWAAWDEITVTGELSESDLEAFRQLQTIEKLDLSGATFTTVPGYFMYNSRYSLKEVILPETVVRLDNYAFDNCYRLNKINLENIKYIGYCGFIKCSNLKSIDISSLESAGEYVFQSSSLESIEIPATLTYIPYCAFNNCSSLKSVILNDGVQHIGSYAFGNCPFTGIELPESITYIKDGAFNRTGLREITIPSGLQNIGSGAFEECQSLTDVYSKALVPPTGRNIINGIDIRTITLHIPYSSRELYQYADGWNAFYKTKDLKKPIDNINIYSKVDLTLSQQDDTIFVNNPAITLTGGAELTFSGDGVLPAGATKIWGQMYPNREYSDDYYRYDYRATFINNNANVTGKSVETHIYFYEPCSRWNFISFPYDVNVADIVIDNEEEDNLYAAIREYDGAVRAEANGGATWKNVAANGVLKANQGYIINMTKPDSYWRSFNIHFPSAEGVSTAGFFATTDVTVPLKQYPADDAHNASWNLIGNPYPAYFDFAGIEDFVAPITIWRGESYQAYSPIDDDVILRPNEAFFVQAPADAEGIKFLAEGRLHYQEAMDLNDGRDVGTKAAAREITRQVFNIKLACGDKYDRARVVINEDAEMAYEIGRDAAKFLADGATQIYSVAEGVNYDINERPLADGIVALTTVFPAEGIYTISLSGRFSSEYTVTLFDNLTGKSIVLNDEEYTFDTAAGTQTDRFYLAISTGTTGIEAIEAELNADADVTVTAINGQVVYQGALSGLRVNSGIYVISTETRNYKVLLNK